MSSVFFFKSNLKTNFISQLDNILAFIWSIDHSAQGHICWDMTVAENHSQFSIDYSWIFVWNKMIVIRLISNYCNFCWLSKKLCWPFNFLFENQISQELYYCLYEYCSTIAFKDHLCRFIFLSEWFFPCWNCFQNTHWQILCRLSI